MNLLLDASGGVAGDMLCAGLLALGADEERVLTAMETMGNRLGEASVALEVLPDGVRRLRLLLENNEGHLAASRARVLLDEGMMELGLPKAYQDCGKKALDILISAEKEAHQNMPEMDRHIHEHGHHHSHDHHGHAHHHHHQDDSLLHEAQDIIMDICGVMTALCSLDCETKVQLLQPVAVGGGTVSFSHGTLPVPAPATRIILERYRIPWVSGPIDQELCTPTGSALLAALGAALFPGQIDSEHIRKGLSRGTRAYAVPPLILYCQKS